jgi:glycosyltransferase involved in cell wall biosynthesis
MKMQTHSGATRHFDGVICFGGEDWWYHNRGHYDMQIMRQLSRRLPVLYVNSIGMRTPSPGEGRMFLSRVRRKLRSVRRGLVRVSDGFCVISPILIPSRAGIALGGWLVPRAVRSAARKQQIGRPLVWVACPTAAEFVEALDPAAVLYQRTDRYECFRGVDGERIRNLDEWLKARADLTVFCSTALYEREAGGCRNACYVDHGVDFDRFASASGDQSSEPADLAGLRRPRIGFVGGIDAHTFDAELFGDIARRLPEAQFILVGACSLPPHWCELPNVLRLGPRPYEAVADYMAACDVLIMPWNRSSWIEACNPVKLKEYLATGRPIVSTAFGELRRYDGLVRNAAGADEFVEAIRAVLLDPGDPQARRERVRNESWSSKAGIILGELEARRSDAASTARAGLRLVGGDTRDDAVPRQIVGPSEEDPDAHAEGRAELRARLDLAACILLAGGLRPSALVAATGRSVLDLSLTTQRTVLDCWIDRLTESSAPFRRPVPIRVVHDAILPPPWPSARGAGHVVIEQEPKALRGPAGVIRDLCHEYRPDQHVVVAEAARYVSSSLLPMLVDHVRHRADVTVAANPDGTPAGMYVIRCGALGLIPAVGFMDLKEQWLRRAVDAALNVRVHDVDGPGTLPLRSRRQFLRAAAVANAVAAAQRGGADLLPAEEITGLRVICTGSLIGPGAVVEGSIVMPGAAIGSNAVVVRSLVAPNGRVEPGSDIVDAIVHAGTSLSDRALCAMP